MSDPVSAARPLPPVLRCGTYHLGHVVHFIQWNRSSREGLGEPVEVEAVADDGTITFTDGETRWSHDPERLRVLLERTGNRARLRSMGVLTVGSYVVSVADGPSPCPADGGAPRPGETLAEELARRGGLFIRGTEVIARLEREQRAKE
jgi:hypothetical protein